MLKLLFFKTIIVMHIYLIIGTGSLIIACYLSLGYNLFNRQFKSLVIYITLLKSLLIFFF